MFSSVLENQYFFDQKNKIFLKNYKDHKNNYYSLDSVIIKNTNWFKYN
jgi:hypothetical protein